MRAPLAMIAAVAKNRVIGRAGGLPWHHAEDLKHFKRTTLGHTLVLGRATYDSIGRPLPGRRMVVVSRDPALRIEGCEVAHDLEQALALARATDPEPIVAGGGQIYEAALPLATKLYLTFVPESPEGDAHFPELDDAEWDERERRQEAGLTFVTLVRREP